MSLYFIKDLIMALEESQVPAISQKEISQVLHYYSRFRTPFREEQFLREAWKTNLLDNRSAIVRAFWHAFEVRARDSSFIPKGWLFPIFFKEAFPSFQIKKAEKIIPLFEVRDYWNSIRKNYSPLYYGRDR